ncbi:MAG: BrxE family protein [Pirellulaceae bacterium]|nr:BrxE family protein [Pirellulaceae bacterium]
MDTKQIALLRLVVARFGEMDRCKWWNTKGVLSNVGEMVFARGFPRSHLFARARTVFAVANARSQEVFNPPDSYTLWHLPPDVEDQLDDAWSSWLGKPETIGEVLSKINEDDSGIVLGCLESLGLVSAKVIERANKLRRADDLRSVPIKLADESRNEAISLLAAAHCCSEAGKLSVPFIRSEEFPS